MDYYGLFVFFTYGALTGSFLNVCIFRIPNGGSVVSPPSNCPLCGNRIKLYDNLPIISFLLLRGKCRGCGGPISFRYPLIEFTTGVLWALVYYTFGLTLQLAFALFFVSVLVVLSAIDYDTKTIPNKIVLPSMIVSLLSVTTYLLHAKTLPLVDNTGIWGVPLGFMLGGGLLYLSAVIGSFLLKKEAIGGGDIKLAAFVGMYLGGYVLVALFIGFLLTALVGVTLILSGKMHVKDKVPFGPFFTTGALITMLLGPELWSAYLNV